MLRWNSLRSISPLMSFVLLRWMVRLSCFPQLLWEKPCNAVSISIPCLFHVTQLSLWTNHPIFLTFIVPVNEAFFPFAVCLDTMNLSPAANFILCFFYFPRLLLLSGAESLLSFLLKALAERSRYRRTPPLCMFVLTLLVNFPLWPLTFLFSSLSVNVSSWNSPCCATPTLPSVLTSTVSVRLRRSL